MKNLYQKFRQDQATQLIMLGIVVGAASGLGAVLFRWLIGAVRDLAFGSGENALEVIKQASWWRQMFMPAMGGLLVGLIFKFFMRQGAGHGVTEVMETLQMKSSRLPKRIIFIKTITSALTIGTGGSAGREGPIAHIGSAIGSAIAQLFRLQGELAKTMISCGAAGGIAATFNAPIAGALFALEILHGDVEIRHFTPIVISSVIATVVSNSLLKEVVNFPVLTSGQIQFYLKSGYEFPFYFLLAILCGLISIIFIRSVEVSEEKFNSLNIPKYLKPMAGGLMMAGVAFLYPQLYGESNYPTVNGVLSGQYVWYFVFALVVLKMLTTSLTLGSGGSGGIFAPCLFVGAVLGEVFGMGVHSLFPNISAEAGSYALVGMGAILSGVSLAPLTGVILIFEITGKYTIILPLMIACAISTIMVQVFLKGSIFTRVLNRKGVRLRKNTSILRNLQVSEVMRSNFTTVRPELRFKSLLTLLTKSKQYAFPVVDSEQRLLGIVSLQDFQELVLNEDVADFVVVADLMTQTVLWTYPEEDLEEVLMKIGDRNIEYLPVVESSTSKQVVGLISRRNILARYNHELLEARARDAGLAF